MQNLSCVAWEQARRGALGAGAGEGIRLRNLNICIERVDAKCLLAEMT